MGGKSCKESRKQFCFIQNLSSRPYNKYSVCEMCSRFISAVKPKGKFGFLIVAIYNQSSPKAAYIKGPVWKIVRLLSLIPKLSNTGALGVWPAQTRLNNQLSCKLEFQTRDTRYESANSVALTHNSGPPSAGNCYLGRETRSTNQRGEPESKGLRPSLAED